MKKLVLLPLLFASLGAFDLPDLIEKAQKNEQVQSYVAKKATADLTYKSVKSSYIPRIDIGASASFIDERGSFDVPETYKAFASANFIILDGFKRENLLDEKSMRIKASEFDLAGFKKAISLQVISLYLNLENVYSDIDALKKNREQLISQLERFKLFFSAGIATEVDVERLKAAVSNADYLIASREFEIDSYRSNLELLSGEALVGELVKREVKIVENEEATTLDSIEALSYRTKALGYTAEQANASYYPTVSINDTFTFNEYGNFNPSFPVDFVDKQNRLTIQASMNLFDYSAASEARQAIKMQQHALQQELSYQKRSVDIDRELALKAISRAKTLLEAATKSKESFDKTFVVVKQKYEARIVDYIRYLDALTKATEARAQYNRALSGLNSANAAYIFNLGKDPKEYVQ